MVLNWIKGLLTRAANVGTITRCQLETMTTLTISEFIYALDEESTYAEYDEQGNVYIYDNIYDTMMAQLRIDSSVWEAEDDRDTFIMSPSLLRLMAELADTPPAKRKVERDIDEVNNAD